MTTQPDLTQRNVNELRMVTKAVALLAVLTGILYVRAIVGGSLYTIEADQVDGQGILLLVFLGLATLSLIAAWRWEGIGGLVSVLSAVVLGALVYSLADHDRVLMAVFYGSPFLVAGILFLACWWRAGRTA